LLPENLEGLQKFETELNELNNQFDLKKFNQLVSPELAKEIKYTVKRNGFKNVKFQLDRLVNEKRILLEIINFFKIWEQDTNPAAFVDSELFNLDTGDISNNPLSFNPYSNFSKATSAFTFNKDTSLQLLSFRVLDILTRKGFPVARIRICPICQKIFWAQRVESPACSKHISAVNSGKTRIREALEEFQQQREKLKKLNSQFGQEHPLFLKQLELVKKLHNKIQEKVKKYGTV
jgi:hypothetical protein